MNHETEVYTEYRNTPSIRNKIHKLLRLNYVILRSSVILNNPSDLSNCMKLSEQLIDTIHLAK